MWRPRLQRQRKGSKKEKKQATRSKARTDVDWCWSSMRTSGQEGRSKDKALEEKPFEFQWRFSLVTTIGDPIHTYTDIITFMIRCLVGSGSKEKQVYSGWCSFSSCPTTWKWPGQPAQNNDARVWVDLVDDSFDFNSGGMARLARRKNHSRNTQALRMMKVAGKWA